LKVILFSFAQFVILFISMLAKFSASWTFSALTAMCVCVCVCVRVRVCVRARARERVRV